jgi:hypothetical protein
MCWRGVGTSPKKLLCHCFNQGLLPTAVSYTQYCRANFSHVLLKWCVPLFVTNYISIPLLTIISLFFLSNATRNAAEKFSGNIKTADDTEAIFRYIFIFNYKIFNHASSHRHHHQLTRGCIRPTRPTKNPTPA